MEVLPNLELQVLLNIKEEGFNYRFPRHEAWRENYELYRDKVKINRLTQRQSVNLPLMKTSLRTLLKDVDDMPVIYFENLDNDKEAETLQNEHWKKTLEDNNAEIQDIVDKKQDFFFGRTFDSWQVDDGKITFDIEDPEDILVSRFMNPYNIDSSRSLVHLHVFKPLSSLKDNPDYDQGEVKKLELFFESTLGLIKAKDNENSLQEKNKKLADMGVTDTEDPVLGETYVELTLYYVFRASGEKWTDHRTGKKHTSSVEEIFHYVESESQNILMKKPQEEIIGTTKDNFWRSHYRYNTWGDDIDKQDFWTDGIADIVRVPNKVLNAWFSQLVENRTMRNLGMQFYDSGLEANGFLPNTFEPRAFGSYGIPVPAGKKLTDVFMKVEIPDLSESLDEMEYITSFTEKATGATAVKQGAVTPGDKTKFEVNAVLQEATQRTQGMSKFYTKAWEQRAYKYLKLIEAAHEKLDPVVIYKKGRNTNNIFTREISPKDWMTKSGSRVKVWSQDEKKSQEKESLNKLIMTKQVFFDNPKFDEIYKRKFLEFNDLTPDETNEIMQFEEQKAMMGMTAPPAQPGQPQPQPMQPIQ